MPKLRRSNIGRHNRKSNQQRIRRQNENEPEQSRIPTLMVAEIEQVQEEMINPIDAREQPNMNNQVERGMTVANVHNRMAFNYDPAKDYAADVSIGTMNVICPQISKRNKRIVLCKWKG